MQKINTIKTDFPYLSLGLFFSIIVHIVFFYFLVSKKVPEYQNRAFVVNLLPTKSFAMLEDQNLISTKKQIVDESDKINNIPPKQTRLLAEKNNSVEKEQIKRGNSSSKQEKNGKTATQIIKKGNLNKNYLSTSKKNNMQNKEFSLNSKKNNMPKLGEKQEALTLKLDSKTLFSDFKKDINGDNNSLLNTDKDSSSSSLNYKPFSRPMGSGAKFLGSFGSSMYLPNLPDGDLTLLNTKAEHFAVFVRRVATRVFSELRQSGWESLSAMDIRSINSFSEVEVIMSLNGKILNSSLLSSSGSFEFDNILQKAVRIAATDNNPPESAKIDDGNIHFLFQAKSWSRNAVNPNGMIGEQRWLFLSSGLK